MVTTTTPDMEGTYTTVKDEKTKLERQRGASTRSNKSIKSTGSYGAMEAGSRRGSTGSRVFLKRTGSTATTDKEFERPISQVPSGKSLTSQISRASIRTRLTSVSRSEYHDDLKTSLASGLSIKILFATFIIAFGSCFQFGYNIGVLNNPAHLIKTFYNETYTERYGGVSEMTLTILWSLTTAAFIPGGMIGAFIGGAIADKIGRKKSILFSHIFAFIGAGLSSACVAAKAPELIMLGRFFLGINSGIGNCVAPMYLTEIAPFNLRGAFGTVAQLSITIGIFLSSVFGLDSILGTRELWPYLILLEAIPAFTSLVILPCLPESPRYLLLVRGERDAAEKSLQFYRAREDVSTDMEEMDTEHQEATKSVLQEKKEAFTVGKFLSSPDLRRPLFIACFLQLIQQFSGINAVFFYSSSIFKQAGVAASQIPYAVIGTNAVNVFMTIISVPLMDVAGRRPLLLIPMLCMIFDLVLITIGLNLKTQFFWMNYITVACVIIYVICFAVGLGPIPMMIGSELFRQDPRPLAMAAASVCNWVFTFIIALGFEALALACGDFTFLIFLILMILFTLFVFFKVPETKNKTFEEIAHQFAPGPDLEVEEMIDDEDGVFDDALPNDMGEQEDHRLVSFYLKGQEPGGEPGGEQGQEAGSPDTLPLTNGTPIAPQEAQPLANGPAQETTMNVPPGVPFIDASPASERTNPSPLPLNPSKESLQGIKTPDSNT